MSEYIGSKCIVCGKLFTKNDDIVVCPDCGTPYHRECYFKEGKCINTSLHEQDEAWKPDSFFHSSEAEAEIQCSNCGAMNANTGLFCNKCGFPLNKTPHNNQNTQQGGVPPFMNFGGVQEDSNVISEQTELNGVTVKDYSSYVGKNAMYYIAHFFKFSRMNSQLSLNISAMLFPEYFFFYRKMNLYGCIAFVMKILIFVSSFIVSYKSGVFDGTILDGIVNVTISNDSLNLIATFSNVLYWILTFGCASFANWLYYKKAGSEIKKINSEQIPDSEKEDKIKQKGGTSLKGMILAMLIQYLIVSTFFLMFKTGVIL